MNGFTQFINGTLAAVEVEDKVLKYLREHQRECRVCNASCDSCRRYARCPVASTIVEQSLPKNWPTHDRKGRRVR
jgi:hypothetical protein